MVVLLKTVLTNFHPKQANKSIGDPRGSNIKLFIAILTWLNLTGSNRPLSPFFHPLTLPGYPLECCQFSKFWKIDIKRRGSNYWTFYCFTNLTLPNRIDYTPKSFPSSPNTSGGVGMTNFEKNNFQKNDLSHPNSLYYWVKQCLGNGFDITAFDIK